jgi:hypothetical protein
MMPQNFMWPYRGTIIDPRLPVIEKIQEIASRIPLPPGGGIVQQPNSEDIMYLMLYNMGFLGKDVKPKYARYFMQEILTIFFGLGRIDQYNRLSRDSFMGSYMKTHQEAKRMMSRLLFYPSMIDDDGKEGKLESGSNQLDYPSITVYGRENRPEYGSNQLDYPSITVYGRENRPEYGSNQLENLHTFTPEFIFRHFIPLLNLEDCLSNLRGSYRVQKIYDACLDALLFDINKYKCYQFDYDLYTAIINVLSKGNFLEDRFIGIISNKNLTKQQKLDELKFLIKTPVGLDNNLGSLVSTINVLRDTPAIYNFARRYNIEPKILIKLYNQGLLQDLDRLEFLTNTPAIYNFARQYNIKPEILIKLYNQGLLQDLDRLEFVTNKDILGFPRSPYYFQFYPQDLFKLYDEDLLEVYKDYRLKLSRNNIPIETVPDFIEAYYRGVFPSSTSLKAVERFFYENEDSSMRDLFRLHDAGLLDLPIKKASELPPNKMASEYHDSDPINNVCDTIFIERNLEKYNLTEEQLCQIHRQIKEYGTICFMKYVRQYHHNNSFLDYKINESFDLYAIFLLKPQEINEIILSFRDEGLQKYAIDKLGIICNPVWQKSLKDIQQMWGLNKEQMRKVVLSFIRDPREDLNILDTLHKNEQKLTSLEREEGLNKKEMAHVILSFLTLPRNEENVHILLNAAEGHQRKEAIRALLASIKIGRGV